MRRKVEAVIGHLKENHRMDRSQYRGFQGDQTNVSLSVTAWDVKRWVVDTGGPAWEANKS